MTRPKPHYLPDATIALMRKMKREGHSLAKIAEDLSCAQSTVSLHCRDLFDYPYRKYKTEEEARRNNYRKTRKEARQYSHEKYLKKLIPCNQCGKPRKPKILSGLCATCYRENRRQKSAERKRILREQKLRRKGAKGGYPSPKPCPFSPTGKHSHISGQCLYCERMIRG
jgi:IS30 family transposase